jgi:hypothetical protein
MGVIAGYAAIAAFAAGLLFFLLAIAGFIHLRRTPLEATI